MHPYSLIMATPRPYLTDGSRVSEVLRHIADDLRTIARDELELGRNRLSQHLEHLIAKASAAVLGAIVALIGLGLLCLVAVAALAYIIPPLWFRLLIMAIVYIVIGAALAAYFGRKVASTKASPNMDLPRRELRQTVEAVQQGLHS